MSNMHRFTLLYALPSELPAEEELMGGLLAAGCNDALVGLGRPGHVALEFERAAVDRDTAIQTAQLAVATAWPRGRLVEVR
jgi:hypothetical protein